MLAQQQGRERRDQDGLDEIDGERIRDGQVPEREEEEERARNERRGAARIEQRVHRFERLLARRLDRKGQGEGRAEEEARPDHLQDGHTLLAEILRADIDQRQDGHGAEHQADADQGVRRRLHMVSQARMRALSGSQMLSGMMRAFRISPMTMISNSVPTSVASGGT